MFEIVIIIQILSLGGFYALYRMISTVKVEVLKDLEQKKDENNEILGLIVQNFSEQISASQDFAKDGGFKDAKNMMKLRMEEFKFGLLSQFAEYASNKFMKIPLGVHQLVGPEEEDGGNVLKPASVGEEHG